MHSLSLPQTLAWLPFFFLQENHVLKKKKEKYESKIQKA